MYCEQLAFVYNWIFFKLPSDNQYNLQFLSLTMINFDLKLPNRRAQISVQKLLHFWIESSLLLIT